MLDPDVIDRLESGCGLAVGFVTASGLPFGTRGWGLTVLDNATRARLLLRAEEVDRLGYPSTDEIRTMVAVTGCSVLTLRATQIKGPISFVEPANDDDKRKMAEYCNAFFDDIAKVDAIPRHMMERLVPPTIVACVFEVVEVYDQTPGPNAGAPVEAVAAP
jgi:hypothetical protein